MKPSLRWQFTLALILLSLSVLFYVIHYAIFKDIHHIFLYFFGDMGFLFVDVLIVMLVLHQLLVYREKRAVTKKLNVIISAFFSEVGTEILKIFSRFDAGLENRRGEFIVTGKWSDKDFERVQKNLRTQEIKIDAGKHSLDEIKDFLAGKKSFLLNLLESPQLLEHESFTELLWAVFHLADELEHRKTLSGLPESDHDHLSGDITRAYRELIRQWLDYMKYLKKDYPYLFSLAMRTNPFDAKASVEVR